MLKHLGMSGVVTGVFNHLEWSDVISGAFNIILFEILLESNICNFALCVKNHNI